MVSTHKPLSGSDSAPAIMSVGSVMRSMDERVKLGDIGEFSPISTGFHEIDLAIGGGFRLGQLALISGVAGVGKTSLAMQMARNIALSGQAVCLFVCFEHEVEYLLQRLISMESIGGGEGVSDGLQMRDITELVSTSVNESQESEQGFVLALKRDPRGARALARIARYSDRLFFMKGSIYSTTIESLAAEVRRLQDPGGPAHDRPVVLFVDYLQKIATQTSHVAEEARSTEEVEGLKEIALGEQVVVVAIAAAETEGLKAQRLNMQHLSSTPSMAYEADIIMVMNEKYDIVDSQYIKFNRHQSQQFHHYAVVSIEKNRMGSDLVDIELRKQLQFCHFNTQARRVEEKLVTGRHRE